MPAVKLSLLDTTKPEEIATYEKNLFRAFYSSYTVILDRIWQFDVASRRARTGIPYCDQEIVTAKVDGALIAAGAFNCNMQAPLQLEMMGFTVDKNESVFCEGLAIFNSQLTINGNSVANELKEYSLIHLKTKKIRKVYGTCNQKKLRGYTFLGFEVIAKRVFERGTVYLIEKNIE